MKISPCEYHGLKRWSVSFKVLGKRQRRFFKSPDLARTFARAIKDNPGWASLPMVAQMELAECWRLARDRGYTVPEACRFFEAHGQPGAAAGISLDELCSRFLTAKRAKQLRPESLRLLETTLDQFRNSEVNIAGDLYRVRGDRPIGGITREEIAGWIAEQKGWGPWRIRGACIDLSNLFRWAVRGGLLQRSPMDGIRP